MKTRPRARPIILVILAGLVCLPHALSPVPALADDDPPAGADGSWWDGFEPYGAMGPVEDIAADWIHAAAVFEGDLVVGGAFGFMDGVPVPHLARWTAEGWQPFCDTPPPWPVRVMAVHDGSLVVGGNVPAADDSPVSSLYRWTGTEWEAFGPAFADTLNVGMTQLKTAGERLYLVATLYFDFGEFFSYRPVLMEWDGSVWSEIDIGHPYAGILDLEEYEGDLVVAGHFYSSEADSFINLARWTGSRLEPLGGNPDDWVRTLVVDDGRLIAGGSFESIEGLTTGPVAVWDGHAWTPMGMEFETDHGRPRVDELLVSGETLYAFGSYDRIGDFATSRLATWNGQSWQSTPWYWDDIIRGYSGFLIDHDGRLLFGGGLEVGSRDYEGLARWDNGVWLPFPDRGITINHAPTAMLPTDEGLVVAAEFTRPGTLSATRGIAVWDGLGWSLLAEGINEDVRALARYRGHLVAGGSFTTIAGHDADYIAHRVDGQWRQVGNGMDDEVFALAVHDNKLVAGGYFHRAGTRTADLVAAWDGLSWRPLGDGFRGAQSASVRDLEVYGDGLVACGTFVWSGELAVDRVARWDGRTWSRMGPSTVFERARDGLNPSVLQLARWRGQLVARGVFDYVGGEKARGLARWDGRAWSPPLPVQEDLAASRIAVYRNNLVVADGGRYVDEDRYPSGSVVQYDGSRWLSLGSGVGRGNSGYFSSYPVLVMSGWDDRLFVGGDFMVAGGGLSPFLARWDGAGTAPPPVDRLRAAPNPTADRSTIEFRLDGPGRTSVQVFDIQGRRIKTLHDGFLGGGDHTATWDLRDEAGRRVPAGVYFLRVQSPFSWAAEKVVVIR